MTTPDPFVTTTPDAAEEPRRPTEVGEVRLMRIGSFRVGGEGEEVFSAALELDGRPLYASEFQISPADFDALNAALGGLPPRSHRGRRRWVADRIAPDMMTVRDASGREWYRLRPGVEKWSRLDYQGCWAEADLIFDAGPVTEVTDISYTEVNDRIVRTRAMTTPAPLAVYPVQSDHGDVHTLHVARSDGGSLTAHTGEVTVGPPEVATVGDGLQDLADGRLGALLWR